MNKQQLMLTAFSAMFLSACVGSPKADFANIDPACAQQCSASHTKCMSGFTLFPLAKESACKTGMETCAKTCPTKSEVAAASPQNKQPTAADRLRQLETLRDGGLISKDEYEFKRQEILRTM
jgi:hypothetical protein